MNPTTRRPLLAWLCASLATFIVLSAAIAPAQAGSTVGSGKSASETRMVSGFEAIALHGSMALIVRQAGKEAVEVVADDNLLPLIETLVESTSHGATLVVRFKRGESLRPKTAIRVSVDVMRLTHLAAAGSGDLQVQTLKTPSLRLVMTGSSNAKFAALHTEQLDVHLAGSGNVDAAGEAKQVKISISGSGNVGLEPLAADDVTVRIAGSGDAKVTANKALGVSIAGSGDVEYGGNATAIRTSVAGSGRVVKR